MEDGLRQMQYLAGVISEQAYYEADMEPGAEPAAPEASKLEVREVGPFSPEAAQLLKEVKALLAEHLPDGGDVSFYGKEAWKKKEGEDGVGSGCELAFISEGSLYHLLNGRGGQMLFGKIQELAKRHGMYMDQGFHWSWHFFKR